MIDIRVIPVFLPFLAAMLYGLSYALSEKVLTDHGLATYMFASCIMGLAATAIVHFLTPFKINFLALTNFDSSRLIIAATLVMTFAWLVTLFAIKDMSANYAAIGEISYPLFTVLFGYLLFSRTIYWSTALGAALILCGSFLIVTGKLKG